MKQVSLFEYGIKTEESDIRAHVSVVNQSIYVFETKRGIECIDRINPLLRKATQPGVDYYTSEGWVVPYNKIEDIRIVLNPFFDFSKFKESMTTSEKGRTAIKCVETAMARAIFPLWVCAKESDDKIIQISGTDIIITCNKRVQVKCDWRCGKKPNGTGNLFLQKAETNPFKQT